MRFLADTIADPDATAEKSLKVLLQNLCTEAMLEADLADSQALTKQLALVFDFVLRFDDLKARISPQTPFFLR